MENDRNRGAAWNNQQRLNGVYNKSSGSSSSGRTSATTDRYNSAVKSAADKERVRIRDEQWKKK